MPDDPRHAPGDPKKTHRRVTFEMDDAEPESARSMGVDLDPETLEADEGASEGSPAGELLGMGTSRGPTPSEPDSDVTEVPAWCDTCGAERRFVKQQIASEAEAASESPSVEHVMRGFTAYVCEVCGMARRDLVEEHAYGFEQSDAGNTVRQFPDSAATMRDAESRGVEKQVPSDARPPSGAEAEDVSPSRSKG